MTRYISTYLGGSFHFDVISDNKIEIEDIAHSLSMQCRFTGHCNRFYSVAEHSVWVASLVAPELALSALLHDAAEAYIGDVAKPLKRLLPDYAVIEQQVELAIAARFGLPYPMHPEIKRADMIMLKHEVECLFPAHVAIQLALPGDGLGMPCDLECLEPADAKARFLTCYKVLTAARNGVTLRDEGDVL